MLWNAATFYNSPLDLLPARPRLRRARRPRRCRRWAPNRPCRPRRAAQPNPRWSPRKTSIASSLSKCAGITTTGTGTGTGVTGAGAITIGTDTTGTAITGTAITGDAAGGPIALIVVRNRIFRRIRTGEESL